MSKIYSLPSEGVAKNVMTEEQRRSLQALERVETEKEDLRATSLKLDGTNKVSFPGFPYVFEGLGEKIIVSIDVFKSGYECKACKGLKKIETHCRCEDEGGRPGYRYSNTDLDALMDSGLDQSIISARQQMACSQCLGDYPSFRLTRICSVCKGIGATLILPETSKNLPTTGVVVSMGQACSNEWRAAQNKPPLGFAIGDRILFGPYAGNMVPTKAGILFKIMDADHAWCRIEGAEDMAQFDFILQDDEVV
jgi:co-chaperonin GroES (HSP10)